MVLAGPQLPELPTQAQWGIFKIFCVLIYKKLIRFGEFESMSVLDSRINRALRLMNLLAFFQGLCPYSAF